MSVEYVKTDENLPPVAVVERPRWTPTKIVIWVAIDLIAAIGWVMVAFVKYFDPSFFLPRFCGSKSRNIKSLAALFTDANH